MLKPVVDFFLPPWNAPIWIALAAFIVAGMWLYERREAVAPALRRRLARILPNSAAPMIAPAPAASAAPPAPLSTTDIALIERVLDACDEQLVSPDPIGLEDPRAMLRSALSDYLRGGDPRGRRVATLLADRHTHEAQDLAVALAGELPPAAAAQAWLDASAVSLLNDARAAIVAAEKAREFGAARAVTLSWLGRLYLRRGRLGEAEAAFRSAEGVLPHDEKVKRAAIFAFRAEIALKRGDRLGARSLFEASLGAFSDAGAAGEEGAADARARLAALEGASATGDEN